MLSTSKNLEGHIGLGLSICVHLLRLAYSQERFKIGSYNLISGMCMKNKRTCIFIYVGPTSHCRVMPLWDLFNKRSGEPLELGA